MKIYLSFWLFTLLSASLLPGCRAKTSLPGASSTDLLVAPVPPVAAPPDPMPQSPFQITARANQTDFEVGKPIEFEIEIKNISDQTADLNFKSGQKFDFSAQREGEKQAVWSYGMNKRFMQSLQTVSLEAGKSLRFETAWDGAKPGIYTIGARIMANGGLEATPFQLVVK